MTTRSKSKVPKKRKFDIDDDIDTDELSVSNTIGENHLSKEEALVDRCYPWQRVTLT